MASQENIDSARKYEAGRVAAALLETYGNAAMAIAAMTASRSYKVQRRDRAKFWLGVCEMIRERSALIAQIEAKAATLH